jgi:hypothetical protein
MGPHFGLMDAGRMDRAEAARLRARLHWRGGHRRLTQGKTALAVATLYDALVSGLRWHLLVNPMGAEAGLAQADLENDRVLFTQAAQAGVFNLSPDLPRIQAVLERALLNEQQCPDLEWFVERVEGVLTRIGILPFVEATLPPEDPETE